MKIFSLTSTDMTQAGNRMGDCSTETNYTRYFSSKGAAQEYAEKEYGDKIDWKNNRSGGCSSGDLLHVMYDIAIIRITK
jgi:hypothetical protein